MRTTGSTSNKTGNATAHDNPHAESQIGMTCEEMPMLITVLIRDIKQVMTIDNNNGINQNPCFAGNFGMPRKVVELLRSSIALSEFKQATMFACAYPYR